MSLLLHWCLFLTPHLLLCREGGWTRVCICVCKVYMQKNQNARVSFRKKLIPRLCLCPRRCLTGSWHGTLMKKEKMKPIKNWDKKQGSRWKSWEPDVHDKPRGSLILCVGGTQMFTHRVVKTLCPPQGAVLKSAPGVRFGGNKEKTWLWDDYTAECCHQPPSGATVGSRGQACLVIGTHPALAEALRTIPWRLWEPFVPWPHFRLIPGSHLAFPDCTPQCSCVIEHATANAKDCKWHDDSLGECFPSYTYKCTHKKKHLKYWFPGVCPDSVFLGWRLRICFLYCFFFFFFPNTGSGTNNATFLLQNLLLQNHKHVIL